MSIMICDDCEKYVDTDFYDFMFDFEVDDKVINICEECSYNYNELME